MKAGDYVQSILDGRNYRVITVRPTDCWALPESGQYGKDEIYVYRHSLCVVTLWAPEVGDRVEWDGTPTLKVQGQILTVNLIALVPYATIQSLRGIEIVALEFLTWLPPLQVSPSVGGVCTTPLGSFATTPAVGSNQSYVGCLHEYKLYQGLGFIDSYEYCTKCDEKKKESV